MVSTTESSAQVGPLGGSTDLFLTLPTIAGTTAFEMPAPRPWQPRGKAGTDRSRTFYAAAHVVADVRSGTPGAPDRIDWDATIAFRHHLWDCGLGVADVMDTAQRGMGLSLDHIHELVRRSADAAQARGAPLVCGVGTPRSDGATTVSLADVADEYVREAAFVAESGAVPVIMASRALARAASTSAQYVDVYRRVLRAIDVPLILHWLGEVFDPELRGYWGHESPDDAVGVVTALIHEHAGRISGVKVSLLNERHELRMRESLPASVRIFTGDDYNYPELILGDGTGVSHALLGAFNPLAPLAGVALDLLDEGDDDAALLTLRESQALSRELFRAPTEHYKAGIVFMAYLNGHQSHYRMLAGMEASRAVLHFTRVFELAAALGLFPDPEATHRRMSHYLETMGVAQR